MYHILNGDCLFEQLAETNIPGERIVCREIMVEGPVAAIDWADFWKSRSEFLGQYGGSAPGKYEEEVLPEMEKIRSLPRGADVHLWFEDDVFCQVNMWFVLSLLEDRDDLQVYRIFPVPGEAAHRWRGFGGNTPQQLPAALAARQEMTPQDKRLGTQLWQAYQAQDIERMTALGQTATCAFQDLPAVMEAITGIPHTIETFVQQQLDEGVTSFGEIFGTFCKEYGIYGFGDLQIKRLYDSLSS